MRPPVVGDERFSLITTIRTTKLILSVVDLAAIIRLSSAKSKSKQRTFVLAHLTYKIFAIHPPLFCLAHNARYRNNLRMLAREQIGKTLAQWNG